MENASKALIIAGGILIAILIISLLVAFYDNLKELMGVEEKVELTEQVAEFNKQFDVYYRDNLYGSDILSLANKVDDYNIRQADTGEYSRLDIEVTFKNTYKDYQKNEIIVKNNKYNAEDLKNIGDSLQEKINVYTTKNVENVGKTISALSGLRTNELENLLTQCGITNERKISEIKNEINNYLSYKSTLSSIKAKTFKVKRYDYNNENGRIVLMVFEQN